MLCSTRGISQPIRPWDDTLPQRYLTAHRTISPLWSRLPQPADRWPFAPCWWAARRPVWTAGARCRPWWPPRPHSSARRTGYSHRPHTRRGTARPAPHTPAQVEHNTVRYIIKVGRREGRKEGRKEGKEGRKEGRKKKGRKEGKKERRKERRKEGRKERSVLFNDALNTFYLQLYGNRRMIKEAGITLFITTKYSWLPNTHDYQIIMYLFNDSLNKCFY